MGTMHFEFIYKPHHTTPHTLVENLRSRRRLSLLFRTGRTPLWCEELFDVFGCQRRGCGRGRLLGLSGRLLGLLDGLFDRGGGLVRLGGCLGFECLLFFFAGDSKCHTAFQTQDSF